MELNLGMIQMLNCLKNGNNFRLLFGILSMILISSSQMLKPSLTKFNSDRYNIDLTITNFDECWAVYEFLLEYEPVEGDSLSRTEQVYKRVLKFD